MSENHGDIDLGDTIQWLFTTVDGTGVPTVLTGTPTATAYTDGGVTQSATGVTLTADFDSVVGLNLISIVASGGNGFAAGENIEIVLDAGTVDGNSVVGYAVGGFSIANRSPLRPTTIGRTLDVLTTGEVPIDFDTSIGSLAAAQIEASALDGKGDWNIGKTGYSLTQAFPTNFADMAITVTTGLVTLAGVTHTGAVIPTVSTLTGHTAQTGDSFARLGAPAAASVSADILAVDNFVDGLESTIGVAGAGLTDLGGMSAAMQAEVLAEVNAALDTAISELSQAQPTATPTVRTGLMLLYMALRNRLDVQTSGTDAIEIRNAAGTIISKKLITDDGSDYSEALMVSGP